jgi:hypothetical protein
MKPSSTGAGKTTIPTPPPPAGTAPPFPHPAPIKQKQAQAGTSPCQSLTSAAIKAAIAKIGESKAKATSDVTAHGAEDSPGNPNAAAQNLAHVSLAQTTMQRLLDWLTGHKMIDPPPVVTISSGVFNVHDYVRDAVITLHNARHFCIISAVQHASVEARASFELTTQALELLEPLGAQAGRCYMEPYVP